MQDPWDEFEDALDERPRNPEALRQIEMRLQASELGTPEERVELSACIFGVLASLGTISIVEAREKFLQSKRLGRSNWPALYFGRAAVERKEPEYALEALRSVDAPYFESLDLHWRNVEVLTLTAEALALTGDRGPLMQTLSLLNTEFRKESEEPFSPIPRELEDLLIGQDDAPTLLGTLLDGVKLSDWVYREDLPKISRILRNRQ